MGIEVWIILYMYSLYVQCKYSNMTYSAASLNLFTSRRKCATRSSSCWFLQIKTIELIYGKEKFSAVP